MIKTLLFVVLCQGVSGNAFADLSFADLSTDTLSARITQFEIHPVSLFHAPTSPLENEFLNAGRYQFWQSYGIAPELKENDYKGYILFADPFHYGLKRISFLLGSDCSHFVHRLLQALGADYAYVKTRHWIDLARQEDSGHRPPSIQKPGDLSDCAWRSLLTSFARIPLDSFARVSLDSPEALHVGDVLVFANAIGPRGEHGHMGIITGTQPLVFLSAKNHRTGIIEEPLKQPLNPSDTFVFRWIGPLAKTQGTTLSEALTHTFAKDPSGCE